MTAKIKKIINIFKALACETRLKIVVGLMEKSECNVSLMADKLGLAQPNVSQHLSILKSAGIIEGYRKGTQICYKVIDRQTEKIIQALSNRIC